MKEILTKLNTCKHYKKLQSMLFELHTIAHHSKSRIEIAIPYKKIEKQTHLKKQTVYIKYKIDIAEIPNHQAKIIKHLLAVGNHHHHAK